LVSRGLRVFFDDSSYTFHESLDLLLGCADEVDRTFNELSQRRFGKWESFVRA
jgi:hypothetical protein